jgi:hypothetical protein
MIKFCGRTKAGKTLERVQDQCDEEKRLVAVFPSLLEARDQSNRYLGLRMFGVVQI